jgi:PTH1 family peptidyl-tRNA hydrolase
MRPQFLFIGLGNPGKQYEGTRHNIGFLAADYLAKALQAGRWCERQKFVSSIAEGTIDDAPCFIVKPLTYMNRSGEAIRKLVDFYKLDPAKQLLVCCDDVDIPLGTHRLRLEGGPGTHNGLKSIVSCIGEGFPRLRIGIGPEPTDLDLATWVLSTMTEGERKTLEPVFEQLLSSVREVLKK